MGRVRNVPTILQMEAVECGAACLAMVLGYYKKFIPLEKLRIECGVSRDGSKASNMIKAARKFGFEAKGFRKEPNELKIMRSPMIIHWNFNHFVVLEGFKGNYVYINDPGYGRKRIPKDEFDGSFTGVVLTFKKTDAFKKGGEKKSLLKFLLPRLKGAETALLFVLLAGLALVIPGIVIPVFLKVFVDNVLLRAMKDWLVPLLIAMGIATILRGTLIWLKEYFLLKLETKISISGSSTFLWHVLRLPIEFFSQRYAGEIGSRVALNDSVATIITEKLASTILDVIIIIFYALILIQYDLTLTIIGISIAILNVFFLMFTSKKIKNNNMRLLEDRGKMIGTAMSGVKLIETLKAGGKESEFYSRWSGYQAKLMNSEQEMGRIHIFLSAIPPLLFSINRAAILIIGGFRVLDGHMTLGMLVAFDSLMSSFLNPINHLVDIGTVIQQVKGDVNKLDDVFKYKIDKDFEKPETVAEGDIDSYKLEGYLEIKNLTFGYNKLEPPLIENFSLNLKPGSRIALVGSSGSGKSTIARLICGLYEPWEGQIIFDNKIRQEIPRSVLNNSLAMVDQDISLFDGTIKENISMWDATVPETDIILASKDACIHDDISARQYGYEHKLEEDGRNFSGGQRQRLEIARALVKRPRYLILDEASSALDPNTEKMVDENIRKLGCTCVIVAHRLSTIRDCDEIIVLSKGKIVQRGTHEQLKLEKGLYNELLKAN